MLDLYTKSVKVMLIAPTVCALLRALTFQNGTVSYKMLDCHPGIEREPSRQYSSWFQVL